MRRHQKGQGLFDMVMQQYELAFTRPLFTSLTWITFCRFDFCLFVLFVRTFEKRIGLPVLDSGCLRCTCLSGLHTPLGEVVVGSEHVYDNSLQVHAACVHTHPLDRDDWVHCRNSFHFVHRVQPGRHKEQGLKKTRADVLTGWETFV